MTRRDAIRVLGGGAAMVGMGAIPLLGSDDKTAAPVPATKQPFTLPVLPYTYAALEPHIDALTMEIHHSRHHAAYIKNANKALEGHPALASLTAEEILGNLPSIEEPLRTTLRNNVGGHVNHSLYWAILSPRGGGEPSGGLQAAIVRDFGSVDALRAKLTEAAMKRFGSGWAWLSLKDGKLSVTSSANQDSPVSDGAWPLLGIDVWEHAYYLKHQNVRADYVAAFWTVVDWESVGRRYAAGQGSA
jgi:Fe-Mn family superoxide dismutase